MEQYEIKFFLTDKETCEKLLEHCNQMLETNLDFEIEHMYRIIRSEANKHLINE